MSVSERVSKLAAAVATIALALVVLTAAGSDSPEPAALAQGPPERPNIVVVMTDDQDARSVAVMRNVQGKLVERGTAFDRSYATFPLCCPSRATFLTGRYAHNHGVLSNAPPEGGYPAFTDAEEAMPVALDVAGYRTGLIGKYLNAYPPDAPTPPGWDVWRAAVNEGLDAYGYALRLGDRVIRYGREPRAYRTKVYGDLAVRYIEQSHELGDPFFLAVAPGAPHVEGNDVPPTPAPDYDDRFEAEPLPTPESFNEEDVSDKPSYLQRGVLSDERIADLTALHRSRLASLLPVDKLVGRVLEALRTTGELSNTYVIYTSDNGYLLGEHRLEAKGKLYEESARVPLVMRGPGVPAGATLDQLTANVDLAPTILDAADAAPVGPEPVDGRSLLPLVRDPAIEWRQELLLENNVSTAIRTPDYMYAEHPDGEAELYDLRTDPFQLESLHADPDQQGRIQMLSERLAEIHDCAGASCP
jgi:arylsulfatase A-like enzyme